MSEARRPDSQIRGYGGSCYSIWVRDDSETRWKVLEFYTFEADKIYWQIGIRDWEWFDREVTVEVKFWDFNTLKSVVNVTKKEITTRGADTWNLGTWFGHSKK